MVDGIDPPDMSFGEPEYAEAGLGEEQSGAVELTGETDVLVIAEEEILAWSTSAARPELTPVQLALYAGWTMAVLYGTIATVPADRPRTLPTVNELAAPLRRKLELARLRHLLSLLVRDFPGLAAVSAIPTGDEGNEALTRNSRLESLNLAILTTLTATQPDLQLAYELGRSLRDTANPPGGADALGAQLDRGRVSKLQEWLLTLAPEFPRLTSAVVAASLGRWSDLAGVTVGASDAAEAPGRRPSLPQLPRQDQQQPIAHSMCTYLLRQGDVWLMLLIGELATAGLLTPEGYVAAGEAALRRTGAIVRGILRHYWLGLLCIAAASLVTLFLALRYLDGAGKVWTSIACIGGGLGVSLQTIASTSSRLTAEAERPVFAMAEEDVMAWAITSMPPLPNLTFRGVRHLRRAGVGPTTSLGRF